MVYKTLCSVCETERCQDSTGQEQTNEISYPRADSMNLVHIILEMHNVCEDRLLALQMSASCATVAFFPLKAHPASETQPAARVDPAEGSVRSGSQPGSH